MQPVQTPDSVTGTTRPADSAIGHRWLAFARAGWVVFAVVHLALSAVGLPLYFAALRTVCDAMSCPPWQLTPERVRALENWGLSADAYAAYLVALQAIYTLVFLVIAALLFWRKPSSRLALFVSLTFVMIGTLSPAARQVLFDTYPAWGLLADFLASLGWASFFLIFFYLFPDGRFVPRWTRWLAVTWYAVNVPAALSLERFVPDSPLNYENWHPLLGASLILGLLGSGIYAQLYRYRRVSGPAERQQTKWVIFGLAVAAAGALALTLSGVIPALGLPGYPQVLHGPVGATIITFSFLPVPLSISAAILRYRLWDIDIVINRALVYGVLTACVVGVYVLIVGGLGALFQAQGNLLVALLAAGVVAVLFTPLRERLQRGVNRLMYGERDDPYEAVSRLGRRLEATLAPDAVLPAVVETVRESLRLPYAAIMLGDREVTAAEAGEPVAEPLRLPLTYRNEPVGELVLSPRSGEEGFSAADRRLLEDLARQAGIAAHAVRLTADLQRARERLVSAREEERRRLRRDLHDGLGPQLSSQTLTIDAIRTLMRHDPGTAERLLVDLKAQAQDAVFDIRRLVHALRPPALDDLGFIGALREAAAKYSHNGLSVSVEAPERLPDLPAAVEVAAYRIAQEATTNVVRHAKAHTCTVSLTVDSDAGAFRLEVRDDGRGIEGNRGSGVGLTSMRERAEELGGNLTIETLSEGGTVVRAGLPLPEEG